MSEKACRTVLLVTGPATGGIRSHVRLLQRHLPPLGYRVCVAGPAPSETALVPLTDRFSSALSPRVIGCLIAIQRRCDARVVHAHGYKAALAASLAMTLSGSRAPLAVTAHNLWPATAPWSARAMLRGIARRAGFIAVSDAVAESLRRFLPDASITVIGNGVEIDDFAQADGAPVRQELGLCPDATVIGYFGRLTHEKGADLALATIALLAKRLPAARLLVAGDGPERENLEATAGPEVTFLGERSDIPALLAACDAILIPSRAEGQSIVALEAMAARRPVVASDVGGLGEMVRSLGGLVAPSNDPAAMAAALERVVTEAELRAPLVARGREHVVEYASAERTAAAVASVYDHLLAVNRW
jgi:glycosyltransferase involved in cell wall biosynthesis